MAPKRKNDEGDQTVRDIKKQKVTAARTIAVQSVVPQPVAGPSISIRQNSMQGLPAILDVEKFTNARQFEITAMQDAMKNSKEGSAQRSWQQLPRHLRRRAASHDVRRVPLRLRDKARAEMDPVKKKPSSAAGPKRGKGKRITRTEDFQKRQKKVIWLESHIWHSKRMAMADLWGYRLAYHPTEKSFRPSHRASVHGSILHDASYYSLIELQGPQHILKRLLEFCCEPGANPASVRYTSGTRVCNTHIYRSESYPFDLISPITVIWHPVQIGGDAPNPDAPTASDEGEPDSLKRKRKKMAKGKEAASNLATEELEAPRVVWIRCHPSTYNDAYIALQHSASFALEFFKKPAGSADKDYTVHILDQRHRVNVFEIMGPKSSQVIRGALKPVSDDKRQEFREFWSALKDLQSPGELPAGMIIGMKVEDPRLSFPPKNATVIIPEGLPSMKSTVRCVPKPVLAQSELWKLDNMKGPWFKKKDLDERRSKSVVPGTDLSPQRNDDRIPILLIQTSLKSEQHSVHGWTLIIPAGWSMAFFSSLIHTGTRVGGQFERQTQHLESCTPHFPFDYPITNEYTTLRAATAAATQQYWDKRPPAKRVNFEKMGTRSPWQPDWKVVLGIQSTESPDLVPAQRQEVELRPWLLRGTVVPAILERIGDMLNPAAGLLSEINKLRALRHDDPLKPSVRAEDLLKGALVMVKISILGRGCPEHLAMMYQLENSEIKDWEKTEALKKAAEIALDSDLDEDELEEQPSQTVASPDSIIGYVTSVSKFLEIQQQAKRCGVPNPLVKVRNPQAFVGWMASVHLLDR